MNDYTTRAGAGLVGLGDSGALSTGLAAQQYAKAERDTPPLMRTYDDLVRAQSAASDRLEALASRLSPLLAACAPSPGGANATSRPSASDFDAMLIGRVETAEIFIGRLDDLLRRLSV